MSLPSQTEQDLLQTGGAFGAMLHVLQHRDAAFEPFQALITNSVLAVQEKVAQDHHRLRELLAYLQALVYHFRIGEERADLTHDLERSISSIKIRKEIHAMGLTIAESLRQEGERKGERKGATKAKQQILISLLRQKFSRKVTSAVVANIQKTQDLQMLDEWLANIIAANTLAEVGIPLKK